MKQMNLNENWNLCSAPLFWDITFADEVRKKEDEWMKCRLPADVRMPLPLQGSVPPGPASGWERCSPSSRFYIRKVPDLRP
ncbi:MAG: hypothetical protein HFH18_12620, partial [Ruminococcus sp.]|nr:hypothetical protein [Ruminococcus sp.]